MPDDAACPLCCEELDITDREFYPCKCGYQVCMWCWHRIRESETGLCPACRTPYGEDPHQFSAVDVEEVLKANKEKERKKKQEEEVKDRSALANMRVIRRNLVYAVGLPPLPDETLKKPEYFGQYGKISKIVLNRSQERASAYVTFAHKEDTLSCILALDGFYMDGRNIRASYGTSKYCSAFIKNSRCNNPECTYLHEMGADEDTFTKQEIQAGYVTSGRDVLARQQQIVQEQLMQQGNQSGGPPRKRIGGGGPSGTGKAATNPVFPPPEYDEPAKQAPQLVPLPTGVARATTTATGPAIPTQAKPVRATSAGPTSNMAPPPRKSATAASVVAGLHGPKVENPDPHASLTSLTPLTKRSAKKAESSLNPLRTGKKIAATRATNPPAPMPATIEGLSSIGGDVIGPAKSNFPSPVGVDRLGGEQISLEGSSSALGGEIFTGSLPHERKQSFGGPPIGGAALSTGPMLSNNQGSLLGSQNSLSGLSNGGAGVIGGQRSNNQSTSALASLLGVSLPSGPSALHDTANIWPGSQSSGPSALSSLNGSSAPMNGHFEQKEFVGGSSLIGGIPIGNPVSSQQNGNDIAFLQSLLPGVHITSGRDSNPNWNAAPGQNRNQDEWRNDFGRSPGSSLGPFAPNNQQQHARGPGIW